MCLFPDCDSEMPKSIREFIFWLNGYTCHVVPLASNQDLMMGSQENLGYFKFYSNQKKKVDVYIFSYNEHIFWNYSSILMNNFVTKVYLDYFCVVYNKDYSIYLFIHVRLVLINSCFWGDDGCDDGSTGNLRTIYQILWAIFW